MIPQPASQTAATGPCALPTSGAAREACAKLLAKRTLTNLYNERPTWLANAHAKLDAAVCAATAGLPISPTTTSLPAVEAEPGAQPSRVAGCDMNEQDQKFERLFAEYTARFGVEPEWNLMPPEQRIADMEEACASTARSPR